ncbi:MAG: hypothetical protein AB7Q97_13020 [Gammaproteobacteria bacterium]
MPAEPTAGAARRYAFTLLGTLCACLLGLGGFNYAVDPLQYYRVPTLYTPVWFDGYQRYQNVGLARNQRYETVVIGTSVTENFHASYIARSWNTPAVKLSIGGSTALEQRLILEQALATGQVRHVLWGLDAGSFYGGPRWVRDDQAPFPWYMYRRHAWANVEYLYSLDTLRLARNALRGNGTRDLDRLDTWDRRFVFGREAALAAWGGDCAQFQARYRPGGVAVDPAQVDGMRSTLAQNVLATVRAHPRVTFHLFFPPVSMLTYVPADGSYLPMVIEFLRAAVAALDGEPNVRLHQFLAVPGITDDLDRYKDAVHYDLGVSRYVIDALREQRHRLSPATLDGDIRALVAQVNAFDGCRP